MKKYIKTIAYMAVITGIATSSYAMLPGDINPFPWTNSAKTAPVGYQLTFAIDEYESQKQGVGYNNIEPASGNY